MKAEIGKATIFQPNHQATFRTCLRSAIKIFLKEEI